MTNKFTKTDKRFTKTRLILFFAFLIVTITFVFLFLSYKRVSSLFLAVEYLILGLIYLYKYKYSKTELSVESDKLSIKWYGSRTVFSIKTDKIENININGSRFELITKLDDRFNYNIKEFTNEERKQLQHFFVDNNIKVKIA